MNKSLQRLDAQVKDKYPNLTRSLIQKLIKHGYVTVNNEVITKTGTAMNGSERIEVNTEMLSKELESINLDVMYEDENCVVVNKPEGVLSHSKGAFNPEPTVASWLKEREHYDFPADSDRGGIVHRLDRGTSGVIICAKNKSALGFLQRQFQQRKVHKTYVARIEGSLKVPKAILDLPIERNPKKPQTFRVGINGKESKTAYEVIEEINGDSLIEMKPKTGRTHQLRVHMSYLKHPIVGDVFYNGRKASRLYLHAKSLELTIPGGIRKTFTSEVPKSFMDKKV